MRARTAVEQTLRDIVARKVQDFHLSDQTPVFAGGAGLDSLDFAELVVRLEEALGVDPFAQSWAPRSVDTVGRLIEIYEQALA